MFGQDLSSTVSSIVFAYFRDIIANENYSAVLGISGTLEITQIPDLAQISELTKVSWYDQSREHFMGAADSEKRCYTSRAHFFLSPSLRSKSPSCVSTDRYSHSAGSELLPISLQHYAYFGSFPASGSQSSSVPPFAQFTTFHLRPNLMPSVWILDNSFSSTNCSMPASMWLYLLYQLSLCPVCICPYDNASR